MGKKKQHKQRSAKQRSDAELIQAAERATAHAKWKDALNAYKELNKRQPGQYDAHLTQVQIQRYQAFLQSEMFESADQLLASLRDQLPAEQLKSFELQRAISLKDPDAINSLFWLTLEQQIQADQPLDATLLESLIFSDTHPSAALAQHPEIETLLAVRAGLIALCERHAEAFTTATAKIGRKSQLAHWKLLLRALNAWYSQDDSTLEKCLEKLADLPERAARIADALRLLCQADTPANEQALTDAFALSGLPESGADLMRIDADLKKEKTQSAFKFATSKIGFSHAGENTIQQIVIDRFVTTFKRDSDPKFSDYIIDQLEPKKRHQSAWFLLFQAQFSRIALSCPCFPCTSDLGQAYLKALTARNASPELLARAHYHFAEHLLFKLKDEPTLRDDKPYADEAVKLLNKARLLDPKYPEPGIKLVDFYNEKGATSKANQLLDDLAKTIRDDPKILQLAGENCIQRHSYARAVKQLEQALAIDPHLPRLKSDYVTALFKQSLRHYKKQQINKGRECFKKMQAYLVVHSDDDLDMRNAAVIRLRQLELEQCYSSPADDHAVEFQFSLSLDGEQSPDDEPSPRHKKSTELAHLSETVEADWKNRPQLRTALSYLFTERYGTPQHLKTISKQRDAFFKKKTLLKQLTPEDVITLFQINQEPTPASQNTLAWEKCFLSFLHSYRMHYLPERLDGMLKLLWRMQPDYIAPKQMLETCKKWSKADRHHPQLKLLTILSYASISETEARAEEYLEDLDTILETAKERNDQVALKRGKQIRGQLESIIAELDSSFHHDDGILDGDDDDLDGIFDNFENQAPDEQMDAVYEGWKTLSPKDRKLFEADMLAQFGKKMTKEILKAFKVKASFE